MEYSAIRSTAGADCAGLNTAAGMGVNGGDGGGGGGGGGNGGEALCAAVAALSVKRVPALGSLMRSACLARQPGAALLAQWGVALMGEAIVVTLPGTMAHSPRPIIP